MSKLLEKFISHNRSLLHIDLSDTGLTHFMLLRLGNAMNISPSLLAIHLSGNPGITETQVKRLAAKINATYESPIEK